MRWSGAGRGLLNGLRVALVEGAGDCQETGYTVEKKEIAQAWTPLSADRVWKCCTDHSSFPFTLVAR
jgi:hypothetical protein